MINKIREDREKDRLFDMGDRFENTQNMKKISIA